MCSTQILLLLIALTQFHGYGSCKVNIVEMIPYTCFEVLAVGRKFVNKNEVTKLVFPD